MQSRDELPDPVADCRALTDHEVRAYRDLFGEGSLEWIIARRELARRSFPSWKRLIYDRLNCAYWLSGDVPDPEKLASARTQNLIALRAILGIVLTFLIARRLFDYAGGEVASGSPANSPWSIGVWITLALVVSLTLAIIWSKIRDESGGA